MITLNFEFCVALNKSILCHGKTIQLDLFIPPLYGDQEYYMANQSLNIMMMKKNHSKEITELWYRIKLYQIKNNLSV